MIAVRGGRANGRAERRVGCSGSMFSPAVGGSLYSSGLSSRVLSSRVLGCAGLMALGVACSEGQYNPPSGGGGSGSSAAGASGMTGTAGSGTSAVGGSAGTPGSAGSAGSGPGGATQVYTFQSSLEGFAINYYCTGPAANETCTMVQAQAAAPAGDAGTDAGDSADATAPAEPAASSDFYALEQDGTVGEATPGSAKLTLNFTAGTQSANLAINYGSGTTPGIDLEGKTVRAQVRIEPGAPPTTYAKMYIKTGATFYYADSGQITLVPGSWVPVTFPTAGTPSYPLAPDPTQYLVGDVREIGLEIAATGIAAAAPAVIHLDTVSY
jgi:hypothetical protein